MRARVLATLALVTLAAAPPLVAGVVRLAPDARVRAVRLRWDGPHQLAEPELRRQIATRPSSGLERAQRWVAWLPLVPDPPPRPFSPLTLQEDLVRLRRLYARQGFPEASVEYDVTTDATRRDVTVTFRIREGEPIRMRRFNLTLMDSTRRASVDSLEIEAGRRALVGFERRYSGSRVGSIPADEMRKRSRAWLADRGYLAAQTEVITVTDSAAHAADVTLMVEPGGRSRVGPMVVETDPAMPARLLTRHLPFVTGDWFSARDLKLGQRNLRSIDLFRDASVDVPAGAAGDSAVPVHVAARLTRPRLTGLAFGYVTSGAGVSLQSGWTHPNLTGGARAVDLIALWQTGLWSFADVPDRLFRVTLTMRQPYVGTPAASLSFGPRFEFRDDLYERSNVISWLTTYVYPFDALQSFSVSFDQSFRRLQELRFGGITINRDQLAQIAGGDLLAALNGEGNVQQWTLALRRGWLDDPTLPRHGFTTRPSVTLTGPGFATDVQFARAEFLATTFVPVPIGSSALMLRGSIGRLWPYGVSLPGTDGSGLLEFLKLRDFNFVAGGPGDVRGYESGLLGPKYPHTAIDNDSTVTSDYYEPVTGLARALGTAELRLPIPGASPQIDLHAFLDAGRVWIPDSRYSFRLIDPEETHWFLTTGGGVGYYSPIGSMRIEGGYMLNPSLMDVRDPADVQRAIVEGRPIASVPAHPWRRVHIHFSLGMWF